MSAYIVSVNTIHAMVTQAKTYNMHNYFNPECRALETEMEKLNYLGQMLVDANITSVMARYPDDDPDDLPSETKRNRLGDIWWDEPYEFVECHAGQRERDALPPEELKPVDILMIVSCYKYQSCEFETWEQSSAFVFCANLVNNLIRDLKIEGFEQAPWGIV